MEIERKYLVDLKQVAWHDFAYHTIEQGYLSTNPVVRVRREDDTYYLTYKSQGLMVRQEENLPLTKDSYEHLIKKSDGNVITKRRYLIPYTYVPRNLSDEDMQYTQDKHCTIELDIFSGDLNGLVVAEVEFDSLEDAMNFQPPSWFLSEITEDPRYQNSNLINGGLPHNDDAY